MLAMSQTTKKTTQGKKYTLLLVNALFLLLYIWLAYQAFYDLFVYEPNVHYPSVELSQNVWGKTVVNFTLNIPTTTRIIIFCAALVSIFASVMVFVGMFFRVGKHVQIYAKVQAVSLLICVISYTIQVLDFMNNAFDGVG